jgi:hypothetical protein
MHGTNGTQLPLLQTLPEVQSPDDEQLTPQATPLHT